MFPFDRIHLEASKTVGIYVMLTSGFGLWPLHENTLLLRTIWLVSSFEMILMTSGGIYELYFNYDFGERSVDTLLTIAFAFTSLMKLIFYFIKRDYLRSNIESAIEDWSSTEATQVDSITRKYKKIYEMAIKSYLTIGGMSVGMYFLRKYFFDQDIIVEVTTWDEELQMETTMNVTKQRFLFPTIFISSNVSPTFRNLLNINNLLQSVICVGTNVGSDCFFMTITYHLCGQFQILKNRFASFEKVQSEEKTKCEFGFLVDRQQRLLVLTKSIETSQNIIMFFLVFTNLILFNAAGIQFLISIKKNEKYNAIPHFVVITYTLAQTFIYACISEDLSDEIEHVSRSIYESNWQSLPNSMARDVYFLMILSHTTVYLTGGKLFPMKKTTFTQFFKTSVSYLSVFNAMIDQYL
ncbi:uncharacterized protein [Venturia canescens]|uniref:uncharacterized protein n=1 Tax=Venturia canescens TaxID=32260 RepID=UPI001C9CF876|nr:uncharacterized protein LOC122406997 [Venturia canescens]